MPVQTLLDSPKYKVFISERNKALEQIHLNTQTDLSRMLYEALDAIDRSASQLAVRSTIHSLSHSFEQSTLDIFTSLIHPMVERIKRMRCATFTLANLGELEAIGQATQRQTNQTGIQFKQKLIKVDQEKIFTGQKLEHQVWASLMQLRERILKAFRKAVIQELDPKAIVEAVQKAFPKIQVYKTPPRRLKSIREAAQPSRTKRSLLDEDVDFVYHNEIQKEFITDFLDQDDWDLAVNAYKDTEIPPGRFDQEAQYDPETGYAQYNWELEQDVTHDFVNQVRQGQIDAANELGIQEFVWVPVIDNKTCHTCCLPRGGKTTSEIEKMLSSKQLHSEICDSTVPPAHPHCRCDIAPIASPNEVEGPDWESFDEWLAAA